MDTVPKTIPTEERWLAALVHGSVLLSFLGPFVPGLAWISQRRKSRYVAFQSLQAMGYQAFLLWVGLTILLTGLLVFMFAVGLPSMRSTDLDGLASSSLMERAALFQGLFYAAWFVLSVPGLVGAVCALTGREFYYPFLGRPLESRLRTEAGDPWFDEAREEDWVAGICHSSAVVLFWGMILPLLVWSGSKDSSPRLRFQSLQAFLFQLLMLVSYGIAFVFLFMMMALVLAFAGYMNSSAGITSDAGLYLLIAIFVMLLFMAVMLLALPTFHLFALIAWVRVSKGQDYRYPLLGKVIERRQKKNEK